MNEYWFYEKLRRPREKSQQIQYLLLFSQILAYVLVFNKALEKKTIDRTRKGNEILYLELLL